MVSPEAASVSVTRWRAVRMGSELSLAAPTSLASSEPLPDSVMRCEMRTK